MLFNHARNDIDNKSFILKRQYMSNSVARIPAMNKTQKELNFDF